MRVGSSVACSVGNSLKVGTFRDGYSVGAMEGIRIDGCSGTDGNSVKVAKSTGGNDG